RPRLPVAVRVLGVGRDDESDRHRRRGPPRRRDVDSALLARDGRRSARLRMRIALAAVAAALLFGGCGASAGDVLAVEVSGGPLPAKQILVVTVDGQGSCDQGKLREIPNDRLIEAQGVARDA